MRIPSEITRLFEIKEASQQQVLYFLIFIVVLLLLMLILSYIFSCKQKKKKQKTRVEDFERLIKRSNLHSQEAELLRKLADISCPDDPILIITSLKEFDNGAKILEERLEKIIKTTCLS